MDKKKENWAAGDIYEQFMGRWSRVVAVEFLKWLDILPGQMWLDVGCGTGALTQAIKDQQEPDKVIGLDFSLDFVQHASRGNARSYFVNADGSVLPFADRLFDAIVGGLALNFIPQPEKAVTEMRRIVKPDGVVSAYVWDYADKMEFLRYFWDATLELDSGAITFHEGKRFPICQPDVLHNVWQKAGLQNILVEAIDVPTIFDNFEAYWQPFTVGNFPAPKYVSGLNEKQQITLHNHLKSIIPTEEDGSIHLIARVWAIRGYR